MNCANHSDREKVAFCQNCGKPLCQECTRVIGQAVYCEPCLAAKLAAAPPVPPAGAYVYNDPASGINASGTSVGGTYGYAEPASGVYAPGVVPPHPAHGAPNPVLAGLLGFIPGVGAMYNEQYVKGGVHLIVFVVLVSLANSNGIFGIFVAGWEFYMAFEAYQTARARRDGLPLPNPFGLNDLGHKLGLDKTWNMGNNYTGAPPTTPPDPYAAPYNAPPAGAAYTPPYAPPYSAGAVPPSWAAPPAWEQYNTQMPGQMPPPVPLDVQVPYPGNRFPAGAIWLIGLGALFLLFNAGLFRGITVHLFLPVLLVGLAVYIFVRKMTSYGYGLSDDGTVDYRLRIFRALRSSVWLALVGLLFFLDEFHILTWDHSWPLFIILAGIMTFLKFAVYGSAPPVPPYMPPYGYPPQPAPPAAPTPATSTSTQIVPTTAHDQEGS
jgi:TM2 domain-containing membrane protein YozV